MLLLARPGQIYEILSIPGDSMVVIPGVGQDIPANARGGSALAARGQPYLEQCTD